MQFLFPSRAFLQLSSSPEAFLALRSHFIQTMATISMCHYVLGIGDRHLSNFMVDLESGGAVGIDFGHAFGTATQVQYVQWEQQSYSLCVYSIKRVTASFFSFGLYLVEFSLDILVWCCITLEISTIH